MLKHLLAIVFIVFSGITGPAMAIQTSETASEFYGKKARIAFGDYPQMVEHRFIRALVPHSKTFYFLDGAKPRGASYEALKQFETVINKNRPNKILKINIVIIPTPRDELIPNLNKGLGDIAVGNLTITDRRLKHVDFSEPMYTGIDEIFVGQSTLPAIKSLEALSGREIHVRKSSSYYESLKRLDKQFKKNKLPPIKIIEANEYLEDEDLLEMVDAGLIPGIIIDSHKAEFWAQIFKKTKRYPHIRIRKNARIAWAVRKNSPELLKVVNAFIKDHKKGTLFGNIIFKRYLKNTSYVKNNYTGEDRKRFEDASRFFKKYADQYKFDWLMLAALAYQESRINQETKSHAGAVGVMQILPSTAKNEPINIPDIHTIENNIHAGTKYLRHIVDTYFKDPELDSMNKVLLSFASYNAGPTRISKLRKKAEKIGLDPNIWFKNIEVLAAKHIGRETVDYVSNIFKYYIAYHYIVRKNQIPNKND